MSSTKSSRLEVIHPQSFFDTAPSEANVSELKLIGHTGAAAMYAAESLVLELETLRKAGGLAISRYFHATSSAALPPIARQGALLSSKELLNKNEPIITGEITTPMGALHEQSGGLDDVYASNSPVETRYAILGEDDYTVIFGISKHFSENRMMLSDTGDGTRLGNRVPLEHVTAQIVPYDNIANMQAWSADNTPRAITMSWDAACVLNFSGEFRA